MSILYLVLSFIPPLTTSLNIDVLEEYVKAVARFNKSSIAVVRSLASFTYNTGIGVEKVLKSVRDGNKVPSTLQNLTS